MKSPEDYIKKYYPYQEEMDEEEISQLKFMIEVAQKEAYNQAIEDAAEEVRDEILDWEDFHDFSAGVKTISNPEKKSILRLKL